jgi:hypothetical protein
MAEITGSAGSVGSEGVEMSDDGAGGCAAEGGVAAGGGAADAVKAEVTGSGTGAGSAGARTLTRALLPAQARAGATKNLAKRMMAGPMAMGTVEVEMKLVAWVVAIERLLGEMVMA